jgi:hypothetical protein
MRRSHLVLAFLIAPLVAAPGCGSSNTVWVTGKLLKGGAKYDVPKDQNVSLTFVALEVQDDSGKTVKDSQPYQAELDPDAGTFTVPGLDRQGIPPGKYRIAVTQKMKREAFDAANPKGSTGKTKKGVSRETDTLGNRFGLDTSPILREITKPTDLEIDLDKPTGS